MTAPHDVTAYCCAVGELCRLAKVVPGGMDRLRDFTAAGGPFVVTRDGIGAPSGNMLALIEQLRAEEIKDKARDLA